MPVLSPFTLSIHEYNTSWCVKGLPALLHLDHDEARPITFPRRATHSERSCRGHGSEEKYPYPRI